MLDALTFDAGSTLTPDYMLMLDSRDITGNISDRLMSMTLTDNRGFEADQALTVSQRLNKQIHKKRSAD